MTKLALLGAAALLSAAVATPAAAQEVVYNPGYCAQFYPNANCQNKGPNSPVPATTSSVTRSAEPMRGGRAPVQWTPTTMSAATAAVTPAIDCETARRPLVPVAPSVGGYSLAIPVSLITRSYLAS